MAIASNICLPKFKKQRIVGIWNLTKDKINKITRLLDFFKDNQNNNY